MYLIFADRMHISRGPRGIRLRATVCPRLSWSIYELDIFDAVQVEPYVMVAAEGSSKINQTRSSSDSVRYEGFIVDLMDRICLDLGLRYLLQPTQEYGHQNADGTWNGMIRQLIDKVMIITGVFTGVGGIFGAGTVR